MSALQLIPILVILIALTSQHFPTCQCTEANNRPIIGILMQEMTPFMKYKLQFGRGSSYIAASYVKFIEGAGARVVPIWIGRDKSYYKDIISKINGVLWPGGKANFTDTDGYADAGYTIYKIAKRINDRGDYFPILGICLGFELLTYVTANREAHRIHCDSMNQRIPLEFTPDAQESKLFRNASDNVMGILENDDVTLNVHQLCVTEKKLEEKGIKNKFRILSLNTALDGVRFISSLEAIKYPFYGLQFHPEKNLYEWVIGQMIPHSEKAVRVAQYFANFFVSEARKNTHQFSSKDEESRTLIYNYPVTYTGLQGLIFQQCYVFNKY